MPEKKTRDEYAEMASSSARSYFNEGLNCAECVFKSWLDLGLADMDEEVIALASGLGGGVGGTMNTCGALLGAALALGTTRGRRNPCGKETFEERVEELHGEGGVYPRFSELVTEFTDRFGSVVCRELTGEFSDWESYERRKRCQAFVLHCASASVRHALD